MNKLLAYLPVLYHGIKEFENLTAAETIELDAARVVVGSLLDNQFVLTSDEQAIKRREAILGIKADPSVESLDFRKRRLINRYSSKPPFTVRYLQQRLDYLVGAGRASVAVDVQTFTITVAAHIKDAAVFREVERTVKTSIPANMVYQQQTALKDEIEVEERISARSLNRGTRLSTTWRLGSTPFAEVGPEVIIK